MPHVLCCAARQCALFSVSPSSSTAVCYAPNAEDCSHDSRHTTSCLRHATVDFPYCYNLCRDRCSLIFSRTLFLSFSTFFSFYLFLFSAFLYLFPSSILDFSFQFPASWYRNLELPLSIHTHYCELSKELHSLASITIIFPRKRRKNCWEQTSTTLLRQLLPCLFFSLRRITPISCTQVRRLFV